MSEQPTATPRFVSITMQEEQGVFRFLVIDLDCLDTICECPRPGDAQAMTDALNAHADKIPRRVKVEFDKWKPNPSLVNANLTPP